MPETTETTTAQTTADYEKERTIPINNLDSAWLSAEPDYTGLQNKFKKHNFASVFELFNSGIRLGNIKPSRTKVLEYDLVTAGECLDQGLNDLALSVFFDVASVVEVSHGEKGFRTKAMNMVIQHIKKTEEKNKSRNVFGGKQEDD